jgi:predicted O-methyltransferase YrrM
VRIDKDLRLQTLAGQIWPEEGRVLRAGAALVTSDRLIVDLGAGRGKSACYLSVGSWEGSGARVLSIDLWGSHADSAAARRGDLGRRMFDLQIRLEGVPSLITAIRGRTDVVPPLGGRLVGLLFVDAGHSADAVRADLRAWLPRLAPGAIVMLHDWDGEFPGVQEAARPLLGEPTSIVRSMAVWP